MSTAREDIETLDIQHEIDREHLDAQFRTKIQDTVARRAKSPHAASPLRAASPGPSESSVAKVRRVRTIPRKITPLFW